MSYNKTRTLNITAEQMFKLRNLDEETCTKIIHEYSSGVYEILFRYDLISIEIGDNNELFIMHGFELFSDSEFSELLDNIENTSECIDRDNNIYETQILPY